MYVSSVQRGLIQPDVGAELLTLVKKIGSTKGYVRHVALSCSLHPNISTLQHANTAKPAYTTQRARIQRQRNHWPNLGLCCTVYVYVGWGLWCCGVRYILMSWSLCSLLSLSSLSSLSSLLSLPARMLIIADESGLCTLYTEIGIRRT